MIQRRLPRWFSTRLTALLAGLVAAAFGGAVLVLAQSTTVSIPIVHGDVSQWGSTTVSSAQALSDSLGNPTAPEVGASGLLWDTTQWVRHKAAALATYTVSTTLTSRSVTGAGLVEKSGRFNVTHNPAAGSQATASIAAESGVRHVVDCVSFSGSATTNPVATALTINLRDGATGAGTVIWTKTVAITAATGNLVPPFGLCGLQLVGTTNTAMTLEWSASLANLVEEVSWTGFNVQ